MEEWARRSRRPRGRRSPRSRDLPAVPQEIETAVGHGESWDEALEDVEWDAGDVLVVGSSAVGPIARVFLGSRATKIVRHSPVPVVRGARAARPPSWPRRRRPPSCRRRSAIPVSASRITRSATSAE